MRSPSLHLLAALATLTITFPCAVAHAQEAAGEDPAPATTEGEDASASGDASEEAAGEATPEATEEAMTRGDAMEAEEELDDLEDLDALMEEVDEEQEQANTTLETTTASPDTDPESIRLKTIKVSYTPEEIARTGGSAQLIDEEELEAFEYDDVHDVLNKAAGVYVRQEDGFGLRPNIGIRGANSERSKKITLMEDGILFGPAPYSAPAAYYFPLMQRINGVEVFKGPGAILYGPHTIGGAINFTTRDIDYGHRGSATIAGGLFPSAKLHAWHAYGSERFGLLGEVIHLRTRGFKELDGGGNTGFERSEGLIKAHINTDPNQRVFQKLELKGVFSHEDSRETYLGLTDEDFAENPYRRYRASALDEMKLWRVGLSLTHMLEIGEDLDVRTVAYRHDMSRSWKKFNSFADGTNASGVLTNPTGRNAIYYNVLTGEEDSSANNVSLNIGTNARTFFSQGVQSTVRHRHEANTWSNKVEAGVRVHQDQIRRDHSEELYDMQAGELQRVSGVETTYPTRNTEQSTAFALWALDQVSFWRLTMTPGVRYEYIINTSEDRNDPTAETIQGTQDVIVPGLGTYLEVVDNLGVLAGIHRGFSPVTPGQSGEVRPETSINYEGGVRYDDLASKHFEVVGFFNDYKNMVGQCTFAAGCAEQDLDDQFNAGRAWIYGAEVLASQSFALGSPTRLLKLDLSYTFTQTEALTNFNSENPQLAEVEPGDELPYVPRHQGAISAGYEDERVAANLALAYVSSMRETASQGDEGPRTDSYVTLDALVRYRLLSMFSVYTRGNNLLNAQPIASRRPYGARPISPRYVELGIELDWGKEGTNP